MDQDNYLALLQQIPLPSRYGLKKSVGFEDLVKHHAQERYLDGVEFGILYALAFLGLPKDAVDNMKREKIDE